MVSNRLIFTQTFCTTVVCVCACVCISPSTEPNTSSPRYSLHFTAAQLQRSPQQSNVRNAPNMICFQAQSQNCENRLLVSSCVCPSVGTYKRNTDTRSRNHYCHRKAVSIIHYERVSIALVIRHAMRMRRTLLSSVACLVPLPYYPHIIS